MWLFAGDSAALSPGKRNYAKLLKYLDISKDVVTSAFIFNNF